MTEPVVDHLEAIEVDEQDRHHGVVLAQTLERVLEPVDRQRAVRERGQRVVQRQVAELLGVGRSVDDQCHQITCSLEEGDLLGGRWAWGA